MAKIKWNLRAFEEIRRAPGVQADLAARAARVESAAGDGHASGVEPGKTRARGYVVTVTYDAVRRNARYHSLLKALDAGR